MSLYSLQCQLPCNRLVTHQPLPYTKIELRSLQSKCLLSSRLRNIAGSFLTTPFKVSVLSDFLHFIKEVGSRFIFKTSL